MINELSTVPEYSTSLRACLSLLFRNDRGPNPDFFNKDTYTLLKLKLKTVPQNFHHHNIVLNQSYEHQTFPIK